MRTLYAFRLLAITLVLSLVAVGCDGLDSGVPPDQAEDTATTLSFGQAEITITEESGTVSIPVTISNPVGQDVSAELLYANEVSTTDAADFNLPADAAVGSGNAYVAGSVTFGPDAEDGATQTVELNIQDDDDSEEQEDGVFVLQSVQNATVGAQDRTTVKIGAIQLFFADFADDELAPMTAYSVASAANWETSSDGSPDNAPYAVANGFRSDELSNDWLITPALDFDASDEETLTFLNAKGFNDSGRRGLQVKVSTDYDGEGNPEDFTWTDISDEVTFSEGNFNFVSSGEIDLSGDAFQGDAVYIAFQYQNSGLENAAAWEVDNITVTGQ